MTGPLRYVAAVLCDHTALPALICLVLRNNPPPGTGSAGPIVGFAYTAVPIIDINGIIASIALKYALLHYTEYFYIYIHTYIHTEKPL